MLRLFKWQAIFVICALALSAACSPAATPAPTAPPAPTEAAVPTEAPAESPTEEPAGEPVTLTVWFISQNPGPLQQMIADGYHAHHPNVTVEFSYFTFEDMNRSLRLALDGGTGPDVANASPGLIGTDAYANAGHLVDLTDIATERGWTDHFSLDLLKFANLYSTDGRFYGVPTTASTVGVYYNSEIFAANNIEVPQTFEDFEQALATLKAAGITPISVGALDQWPLGHIWEQLIHSNASFDLLTRLYTLDPTASYEDPAIIEATAKLQEWAQAGYFEDDYLATNFADGNSLFITGQAAMNIGGTWVARDFSEQPEFEAHFFPLPQMNPNQPWHAGGQSPDNNWIVSKYSEHQAEAIDFVDYVLSDEVAQMMWNDGTIVNYSFDEVPPASTLLQGEIYEAMQRTGPGYYMAVTGELLQAQGTIVQQVASGELTPEEAMAQMQAVYEEGANSTSN